MIRVCLVLLASLTLVAPAFAGEVSVTVTSSDGTPVPHAVVTLPGALGDAPMSASGYQMAQENQQFDPFVLVVPEGADVLFPNRDRVRHHVYSFARGNRFELELYGREEERSIRFDNVGNVPIGCNIHDNMLAFIRVVDTPHAVLTDGDGRAVLDGIAAGQSELTVWHPFGDARDNQLVLPVTITDANATEVEIVLDLVNRH